MAYTSLPGTVVSKWDDDYDDLKKQLAKEKDPIKKRKLTYDMSQLVNKIEARLNKDIRSVKTYYGQHATVVDKCLANAAKEYKNAKKLASDFKKSPKKTEFVPQLKRSIQLITASEKALKDEFL